MDGFGVSNKLAKENKSNVLGLGVNQLQSISELQLPNKSTMRMMTTLSQHDNINRPFLSHGRSDVDDPTFKRSSHMTNNIYDDILANVNAPSGVLRTVLQPFDYTSHSAFKSSTAGSMAASLGFPFTDAQWKELERQAMIYNYMVASVPVPADLLLPVTRITRNFSASAVSQAPFGSEFNLRLSNGSDPDPGRCKRTDGKKWRCSKEVAPDQKYCERHMHRGRPRSRKHVENSANNPNKKPRLENQAALPAISPHPTLAFSSPSSNNNGSQLQFLGCSPLPYQPSPLFLDKSSVKATNLEYLASLSSTDKKLGSLDGMEKGEALPMANSGTQWQHSMQSKMELTSNTSLCDPDSSFLGQRSVQEPFLDLNSYANFDTDQQEGECVNLFLDPGVVSLESPCLAENPRSFIDAWSKTVVDKSIYNYVNNKKSSVSSIGKLPPSSLNLSMGGLGYNSINDGMGSSNTQLGSGYYENISKFFNSYHIPAYWVGSPPGGPLAEVLRPSSLTASPSAVSNQSSPITCNGDTESLVATTISLSADSRGNSSSPTTFGSSKAKAEIALF